MNGFFTHTKELLAIIWSLAVIGLITFALLEYGNQKEVLLYLLGYIGGIATTILGAYFTINDALKKQIEMPSAINPQVSTTTTTSITQPDDETK